MCPKPFSWTKNKRKLFSDGKSRGPLLARAALNEGWPIRNRKTVEKIIQNRKTEKKHSIKPKTACETVNADTFSHPSY